MDGARLESLEMKIAWIAWITRGLMVFPPADEFQMLH
jgi:hypothetical protein